MNKLIPCVLMLCLFCSKKEAEHISGPTKISIKLDEVTNLKMSDYISDIDYIELITPTDKVIGNIFKIISKNESIFLFDKSKNSIWIFNEDGYFVNEINIPFGRGPGELEHLTDIYVSDDLKIHALGQFKIVVYDIEGQFRYNVNMEFSPFYIFYDPEKDIYGGYVATMLNSNVDEIYRKYNILYFGRNGDILTGDLNIRSGTEGIRYNIPNYFPEHSDKLYFSPHIEDTIYVYNRGLFEPSYYLDFNEYQVTDNILSKRETYSKAIWDWREFWEKEILDNGLVSNITFYEFTNEFIFLRVGNRYTQNLIVYNKQDSTVHVGGEKFINDLDFGPSPFIFSSSDTYLISMIEEESFLNSVIEIETSLDSLNPMTRELVAMARSLGKTGNPIIARYHIIAD